MRSRWLLDIRTRRRRATRQVRLRAAAVTVLAALVLLPAAGPARSATAAPTATPTPTEWTLVRLTAHAYGQLTTPQAVVATAGAGRFTFAPGNQAASDGPHTVAVGSDGRIWTVGSTGFVVWDAGSPTLPRAVPKPDGTVLDLAVAADGTLYSTAIVTGSARLVAQSPTGTVRWRAPYGSADHPVNAPLRLGPDGVAYLAAPDGAWMPLTTAAGTALPVSDQLRLTGLGLPVTGGLRLAEFTPSPHEVRYVLIGSDGTAVRGWRITSADRIGPYQGAPTLVGGDLVTTLYTLRLEGDQQTGYDLVTLRITPSGRVVTSVVTSPRAIWGDQGESPRVGPDGALYELRTSPATGVQVRRYALDGSAPESTATRPPGTGTGTTGPTGANSLVAPTASTPTQPTPTQGAPSPGSTSTGWITAHVVLLMMGAAALIVAVALVSWLLIRSRNRRPGPPDGAAQGRKTSTPPDRRHSSAPPR